MNKTEMKRASVAELMAAIRELESQENRWSRMGYTEAEQQGRLDAYCAELGRRGEN